MGSTGKTKGIVPVQKKYYVAIGPALDGKIPSGDPYWHKFNGSFRNMQLTQLELATRLYDGHAITTCCDPQWRKTENYKLGQHLGLDFDTEDENSTLSHLASDHFISRYGSIIHTTPSHTPDKPRARVIFLLDTPIHQAQNYTAAAAALLWIFGTADKQCKDPVRFFYGGKPGSTEIEWLNNELPLDVVRDMIKRHKIATERRTDRRRSRYYPPDTTDEHKIADALRHIDPWALAYDEWLAVLMAIHSEIPGPRGLSIAESWGDGKPGEIEHKWDGFKTNGNASGQVTIGTLFAFAKDYGWDPTR